LALALFSPTIDSLIATCAYVIKSVGIRPGEVMCPVFQHTSDEITAIAEPQAGWYAFNLRKETS